MKAPTQKKPPGVRTKGSFGSDSSSATSASQQVATDQARNLRGTGNRFLESGAVDFGSARVNTGVEGSTINSTVNGISGDSLTNILSTFAASNNQTPPSLSTYVAPPAASGGDLGSMVNGTVDKSLDSAANAGTGAASSSGWKKYFTWQNLLIAAAVIGGAFLLFPKLRKSL